MTEPSNCQVRARGMDVQCLEDDFNHVLADTARKRIHTGIWRKHRVHWGLAVDMEEVFGPTPRTECEDERASV